MLKKIVGKLDSGFRRNDVTGWQIRWARKNSHQSFLAREQLECRRLVETESAVVSIFKKKPSGKLGMSSFKITPASIGGFDKEFQQALFAAELVNNQPFELPDQPTNLPDVSLCDRSLGSASLASCEDRVRAAVAKEKNVRLSAAEFFVDVIESRLVNHKGLDVAQEETYIQTEFILLASSKDRENEYINRSTRRFMRDFDLEKEVAQSATFARDATVAKIPKTGKFPVLLSDEPLDQLFNPLIARASGRLKYNKMMQTELGNSVVEDGPVKGDRLSLWSNGVIDRAVGSSRFDSYGTPLGRVQLIDQNKLSRYLADKRYADYLGIPVTGELGNIEVAAGSTPFKKLSEAHGDKPLYHLQAFSAFEPNAITGAFSAEIRAGYEISSKGVVPIKGGSVSGVLQRDLLDCRLSSEIAQRERVLAPEGIFFTELTIAGA